MISCDFAESAWVMTRERLPSGTTMQKAYGILDKFKISRTFFVKTDQEGCAIAASEINAANGITPTSTLPESLGVEQKSAEGPEKAQPVAEVIIAAADKKEAAAEDVKPSAGTVKKQATTQTRTKDGTA